MVGQIKWAMQGVRPDVAFDMIELSTKLKNGTIGDHRRASKCIKKLKSGTSSIRFSPLGHEAEWKMVTFTDASHANLSDGVGSVGAHVVLLTDSQGNICPLNWKSNKIRRVVRSTLAAEMLSLVEGVEDSLYLQTMLNEIIGICANCDVH